jgi:hypothetical protein
VKINSIFEGTREALIKKKASHNSTYTFYQLIFSKQKKTGMTLSIQLIQYLPANSDGDLDRSEEIEDVVDSNNTS